jgi:hypothetical protein
MWTHRRKRTRNEFRSANGTSWQATNGAPGQSYGNSNVGGNASDYNHPRMAAVRRQGFEKPRELVGDIMQHRMRRSCARKLRSTHCTVVARTAAPPRAVPNTLSFIAAILVAAILQLGLTPPQLMRSYVSGTGNDRNPCTFTGPCLTQKAALQLTRLGDEVRSLYSDDYGYVTTNQAIRILGAHGATGVLAANGGVTINGGANENRAASNVQDTVIRGFATGISFQPQAASSFSVNGTEVQAQGSNAVLQLAGSTVTRNGSGRIATSGGGNNSTGANTAANSAPPTSPSPSLEVKNIVSDFGAKCNGVSNDAPAFMRFNSWARAQTLPIHLTIPPGSACQFLSCQRICL